MLDGRKIKVSETFKHFIKLAKKENIKTSLLQSNKENSYAKTLRKKNEKKKDTCPPLEKGVSFYFYFYKVREYQKVISERMIKYIWVKNRWRERENR